jgi:prepilin-type N-terminal cleavage/methylation domain-containing protein
MNAKQQGFTLIEVMIALAIGGMLATGVGMAIYQVFNVNSITNARIQAVKQVENANFYINRDVQMAQTITPQGGQGFPLVLSWTDWDTCNSNQVTYSLQNGNLVRQYRLNLGAPTSLTVARFINSSPADTSCSYDTANHQLTIKLTSNTVSSSKQASETRVSTIIPRPGA